MVDPFIAGKRLKAPARALNEFTKKYVRNQTGEYLSNKNILDAVVKQFDEVKKFSSQHVDPNNLPPGSYEDGSEY